MRISIIVPVLNEEAGLPAMIELIRTLGAYEVIVADGGSSDRTVDIARAAGVNVVRSEPGRGQQMNAGAAQASGDILLFLHADVRLRPGALDAIRHGLADARKIGGVFDVLFDGDDAIARCFNFIYHWRRYAGIFYGDAGIFVRRDVFERLGGYRPIPIMEDYEFGCRMFSAGRLAFLAEPIYVSDRRWRKAGLVRTLFVWVVMQTLFCFGFSAERLNRLYRQIR